jgi:hypothetical protein
VVSRLQEWGQTGGVDVLSPTCSDSDPRAAMAEEWLVTVVKEHGLIPPNVRGPRAMVLTLGQPKALLRQCWDEAFGRLSIPQPDESGTRVCLIVLGAHLTFFHHVTRDFIALVNEDALRDALAPDAVVTLIDDLEDVHERLKKLGEMYSEEWHQYRGFGGLVQACRNLGQLADWRAIETAWADALAAKWHLPHFVLAVKHPIDTLARLMVGNEPCAYLSHPISEPRRQLRAGNEEVYRDFCEQLEAVAAAIRSEVVLFEPTTIDEFRFESVKVEPIDPADAGPAGESTVYLPRVLERWPLPGDGSAPVVEPITGPAFNAVMPAGLFTNDDLHSYRQKREDLDRARKSNRATPNPEAGQQIERLIEELRESQMLRIDNATHIVGGLVPTVVEQVTARDLQLVAQTSVLFVIRPLYAGNESGGVQSEIEHFCKLRSSARRPFLAVFTTEGDEREWRKRAAAKWVCGQLLHAQPTRAIPPDDRRDILVACGRELATVALETPEAAAEAVCAVCSNWAQRRGDQWPGAPSADEGPLQVTRAFAGESRRQQLQRELQAELVPLYRRTLQEAGLAEGRDYAIEWVSAWPDTQALVAAAATAKANWSRKD